MNVKYIATTSAALLAVSSLACAQASEREAVRAGNELYRAGEYTQALEAYEQTTATDPLVLFNRACALQRLGRIDEAEDLLQRVDALARRDDLAADARYNLGSASVEQARSLAAEGNAPAALDAYKRAARLYRDAYELDPNGP